MCSLPFLSLKRRALTMNGIYKLVTNVLHILYMCVCVCMCVCINAASCAARLNLRAK